MPTLDPWRERLYRVLLDAGLDGKRSAEAGGTLTSLVFGSVIVERFRLRGGSADEIKRLTSLEPDEFPVMKQIANDYTTHHSSAATFGMGVEAVIGHLHRELAALGDTPGGTPTPSPDYRSTALDTRRS
jgi:hypothetical protein